MTCTNCSSAIENHFRSAVDGAIETNVNLLTNKMTIKHDQNVLRPRQIISEIEDLGFEAELQPTNDSIDFREISRKEVQKFKRKFILCVILYIPLFLTIWVIPNV